MDKIYKIGYLSGTFDLFHVGHLDFLMCAKAHCSKLIVGINDDEVVLQYKNHMPVIPCEDRMSIVGALKCVDEVIKVSSRDKMEAYKTLGFNVLFMSEDWRGKVDYYNIEDNMGTVGVDVIWIPYKNGISSQLIMKKASMINNMLKKV